MSPLNFFHVVSFYNLPSSTLLLLLLLLLLGRFCSEWWALAASLILFSKFSVVVVLLLPACWWWWWWWCWWDPEAWSVSSVMTKLSLACDAGMFCCCGLGGGGEDCWCWFLWGFDSHGSERPWLSAVLACSTRGRSSCIIVCRLSRRILCPSAVRRSSWTRPMPRLLNGPVTVTNMLTRRKERDTYLATVKRHRWSIQ